MGLTVRGKIVEEGVILDSKKCYSRLKQIVCVLTSKSGSRKLYIIITHKRSRIALGLVFLFKTNGK